MKEIKSKTHDKKNDLTDFHFGEHTTKQRLWYGHIQRLADSKQPSQMLQWILPGHGKREKETAG